VPPRCPAADSSAFFACEVDALRLGPVSDLRTLSRWPRRAPAPAPSCRTVRPRSDWGTLQLTLTPHAIRVRRESAQGLHNLQASISAVRMRFWVLYTHSGICQVRDRDSPPHAKDVSGQTVSRVRKGTEPSSVSCRGRDPRTADAPVRQDTSTPGSTASSGSITRNVGVADRGMGTAVDSLARADAR
jgi:hypothetical protein